MGFVLLIILVVNGEPVIERIAMPSMEVCFSQAEELSAPLVAVCGVGEAP